MYRRLVTLPPHLDDALRSASEELEVPMSTIVRIALRSWLRPRGFLPDLELVDDEGSEPSR